jgi:hypothetical protein
MADAIINTGQLIAADQIVDAIANYYDWQLLYNNAKLFTTLNVLGRVSAAVPSGSLGGGNYRIAFNKSTGMQTEYTTGAAITPTSSTINLQQINSTSILNTAAAFTLINVLARPGLAFRIIGSVVQGGAGATVDVNCLFRINTVTSTTSWTCELLDCNLANTASADDSRTCTSFVTGAYILLSDSANYKDGAPLSDDISTTQDYNTIQMYDVGYGKEFMSMSQATKFDNGMQGLKNTVENRFYSQINGDILFGHRGTAPVAGSNYSSMKGIWGFMNLANPALNTDAAKPTVKVDTGTSIDFWKMADVFADRGTQANDKLLCVTTTKMSILLEKAAHEANQTVRTEMVQFPRMSFRKRSIMVGDVELILVVDDKMKFHPKMYDLTNTAKQEYAMLCLDPRYLGLMYHQDAVLGTMVPGVRPVVQTRDARVEEAHMLAALTLGMWNMNQHVAYGITGV